MIEAQYDKIAIDKKVTVMPVNTVLETKINAKEELKKVLCVSANPIITSFEPLNGEALISGKAVIRVLAATQDDDVLGLTYNADFNERVKGDITPKTKMFWDITALETNYDTAGSVVNVSLLLEISGEGVVSEEIELIRGGGDILTLENQSVFSRMEACERLVTTVENELQVNQSIGRILLAESFVTINDYFVANNVLNFSGKATVGIVFAGEDERLVSKLLSFDFAQEAPAANINEDYALSLKSKVNATKVHMDVVEDLPTTSFTAEIELELMLCGYESGEVSVISDVYSLTHELETTFRQLKTTLPMGQLSYELDASANMPLEGGADRFVAVANLQSFVTKVAAGLGTADIEGYVAGEILFEKENELSSSKFEIPYSYTMANDWAAPDTGIKVTSAIGDLSYRLDRQDAQITAKIILQATGSKDSSVTVLTGIEEGKEIDAGAGAIEVVLAHKGDTLWDIAKWLHMRKEDITAVNPDMVTPLEEDAKIVVYHKI